jgi:hypothetical protein
MRLAIAAPFALSALLFVGCADELPFEGPVLDSDPACGDCGLNASCAAGTSICACDPGFVEGVSGCEPEGCVEASDCDDGDPCNGEETCEADGACASGEIVECPVDRVCRSEAGEAACLCAPGLADVDGDCLTACPVPKAPVLGELADSEVLRFEVSEGEIELAVLQPGEAVGDAVFEVAEALEVEGEAGPVRVLARVVDEGCVTDLIFDHTYEVAAAYSGGASAVDAVTFAKDDPAIVGWATVVIEAVFGEDVDEVWQVPEAALGPAEGTINDVVVLGRGGSITLGFGSPLSDGPGFELAVFENAFHDRFLEVGFVEVSTDGLTFARFDSASLTPAAVGQFGELDPTSLAGLAGKHRMGFGTPFDLAWLRWHAEVLDGRVDLGRITQVRVVDVVGDGSYLDSFGRPIFDAWPTVQTAGFDLDAVGVIGEVP